MKLTEKQLLEIFSLKQLKPFTRYNVLATQYKISVEELKEQLKEYEVRRQQTDIFSQLREAQPLESRIRTFDDALQIFNPALIVGDLHLAYIDHYYLIRMLEIARNKKIVQVIVNGDFFDAGITKSQFTDTSTMSLIDELNRAKDVLKLFTEYGIVRAYFIKGNHDQWMCDALDIGFQDLLKKLSPHNLEIIATDYSYAIYEWNVMIGHLEKYNPIPGEAALQIAKKYQKYAVVIVNHDHIRGIKTEDRYYGVSLGCVINDEEVWYKSSSFNDLPEWQKGAAIINEKHVTLYNDIPEEYIRIMA
jgi:predicted phosphodiesterase